MRCQVHVLAQHYQVPWPIRQLQLVTSSRDSTGTHTGVGCKRRIIRWCSKGREAPDRQEVVHKVSYWTSWLACFRTGQVAGCYCSTLPLRGSLQGLLWAGGEVGAFEVQGALNRGRRRRRQRRRRRAVAPPGHGRPRARGPPFGPCPCCPGPGLSPHGPARRTAARGLAAAELSHAVMLAISSASDGGPM
jgi:hypothetical protein